MEQNQNPNKEEKEQEYEFEVDYRDPQNYQIVVAIKCLGATNKYQVFDNFPTINQEPDYVRGDPWAAIRPLEANDAAPDRYDIQIFHLVRALSSLYARKLDNFELANIVAEQILDALYGGISENNAPAEEASIPTPEAKEE